MLSNNQQSKALKVWEYYSASDKSFQNANHDTNAQEIDEKRLTIIPHIRSVITDYINGNLRLEEFKTEIDGINKKNLLWGFRGINGQMYFNMLFNASQSTGRLEKFDIILKEAISVPKDIDEAKSRIRLLADYSDGLKEYVENKKSAPRTGSINFFISYFWQIQDHNKFPVFYISMVEALQDLDIWTATWDYPSDYEAFYELNNEFISLFGLKGKEKAFWTVEHAFWLWSQKTDESTGTEVIKPTDEKITTLPNSYIPPVVSIIPQLAKNDEQLEKLCQASGVSLPKIFEERISQLLRMLGYEVETLGQGYRAHDGTAICSEYHYALLFDAKVRRDGYSMGTDDRAIREYISVETDKLKRRGIRNIYFIIISSSFNSDFDEFTRTLKMETDIREVIFLEASALLTMLEQKLRNPEIDLVPKGLQNLFAQSGILTNNEVKDYFGKG